MKMICDVPNEVIESVRMGTWCGSSVLEKMIANGTPLDKIYADIQRLRGCSCSCSDGIIDDIEDIFDKYKTKSEEQV